MRNPLKRYYFIAGETPTKMFDCTASIWIWQNPQDEVTATLVYWQDRYGPNVSIRSVTKL